MDKYIIITDNKEGTFAQRLNQLGKDVALYLENEKTEGRTLQYTKIFLSDAANQEPLLIQSDLFCNTLVDAAHAIIQQPPLGGSKIAVLLKTVHHKDQYILHSIRLNDKEAANHNSYLQTMMLFEKYIDLIKHTGMTLKHNCIRTWIYVRDIDANYAGVVKARNDVFRQHGLTVDTHFIASTGIGGRTGERNVLVAMDFLTLPDVRPEDKYFMQALTHLNPTHEYGVAFERGTRITLADKYQYFISGTASIDNKGEVVHVGDVALQTQRLLSNISALLADGGADMNDIQYFIIYLRDNADYNLVNTYMTQHYPEIPRIITNSEVCRPAWLIEMECIAEKNI